tara:strand:- start:33756 stop:34502 length:747 start_codon:yes stop_codon:yes gene_type:complete
MFESGPGKDLQVTHEWPTIIGTEIIELPQIMKDVLVKVIKRQDSVFTEHTYNKTNKTTAELAAFDEKIYNIFDYSRYDTEGEITQIKAFEKIMSKVIRTYVTEAWQVDPHVEINVRGFGNVQNTFGRRTAPHFHHGWDGVLAHYVTVGNEYESDVPMTPMDTPYSGQLLLLDTRPSTCIPDGDVRNDVVRLNPVNGLTVIHPGYVWHETHTHTQTGDRVLVAINFHIWNRNFDELPTSLDNSYRPSSN